VHVSRNSAIEARFQTTLAGFVRGDAGLAWARLLDALASQAEPRAEVAGTRRCFLPKTKFAARATTPQVAVAM